VTWKQKGKKRIVLVGSGAVELVGIQLGDLERKWQKAHCTCWQRCGRIGGVQFGDLERRRQKAATCICELQGWPEPYMAVCMVISMLRIPYIHRKYVCMYGLGQP